MFVRKPAGSNMRSLNGHPCHWCRRPMIVGTPLRFPTRDHVVAQSHSGGNGARNIVIACEGCNNLKGDMTIGQWFDFMAKMPDWWRLAERKGLRGKALHEESCGPETATPSPNSRHDPGLEAGETGE